MAGLGIEAAVMNILIGPKLVDGFGSMIADDLGKATGPAAEKAGKDAGDKFADGFKKAGDKLTKTLTPALLAIGTTAVASFLSIDEGLDKVRVNTGATGDTLAGLEDTVKDVATSSTLGFGEAADVISILYQRLGLVGEPLETLATQIANLQQITGAAADVDAITKLFAAFAVPAAQQEELLNRIFRASQKTGVGFNELVGSVSQNAAAFKELGFSTEEAVALIAQLTESGADVGGVLAGLKKSIVASTKGGKDAEKIQGKLAKSQETLTNATIDLQVAEQKLAELRADPKAKASSIMAAEASITKLKNTIRDSRTEIDGYNQALNAPPAVSGEGNIFEQAVKQIETLLAAGDEAAAKDLAAQIFGPKAFVPVIDQIKAGTFELGGFVDEITAGGDTIGDLAAETADFGESLDIARKKAAVAFEPLGAQIGQIIQDLAVQLTPAIEAAGEAFAALPDDVQKLLVIVGGLGVALGPAIRGFATLATIASGFGPQIAKIGTLIMANPWIAALAGLAAIAFLIYKNWDKIYPVLKAIFDKLGDAVVAVWNAIKAAVEAVINFISGAVRGLVNGIIATWNGLKAAVSAVWNGIGAAVRAALDIIRNLIIGYVNVYVKPFQILKAAIEAAWNGIKAVAERAFSLIASIVSGAVSRIISIWSGLTSIFNAAWDGFKRGAQIAVDFVIGIINRVKQAITDVVNSIKNLPGTIAGGLKNIGGGILNTLNPFRAEGGPVSAGGTYIVGERGPEIFQPRVSGSIIPNEAITGSFGGDMNYQITIVNPTAEPASTSIPNALRKASYLRN